MTENLLYFPAISVPETEWFTRALLYWDRVGTIVPFERMGAGSVVSQFTEELLKSGLLTNVLPDDWVYRLQANNYFQPFIELIKNDPTIYTKAQLEQRATIRIHSGKTGTGLAKQLEHLQLARYVEGPEYDAWYDVQVDAANLLMAYLASILAQRDDEQMYPITDSEECLEAFMRLPAQRRDDVVAATDWIRTAFLDEVLPAPTDPIDVAGLAAFKDRNGGLLVSLRTDVEKCVIAAADIDDPKLQARQIELDKRDLREQRDEIAARMIEQKWQRIAFGTVGAVVASAMLIADATIAGETLAIGGNSLGLASAVYAAFEGKRGKERVLGAPMAYAALAQSAARGSTPFKPSRFSRIKRNTQPR